MIGGKKGGNEVNKIQKVNIISLLVILGWLFLTNILIVHTKQKPLLGEFFIPLIIVGTMMLGIIIGMVGEMVKKE